MDPALQELIRPSYDPAQVVEALIRLAPGAHAPRGIRIVTRFGDIATCRVRRGDISLLYGRWPIMSFKAARPVSANDLLLDTRNSLLNKTEYRVANSKHRNRDIRHKPGMPTGKGVMIGVIDWGIDIDHPNFKWPDGRSRLKAIWDQRGVFPNSPAPFGYGKLMQKNKINRALRTRSPYRSLGMHPGIADARGIGAHGTHVTDIAAGSGNLGPAGVAPETDLAFVHLASNKSDPLQNLGDSVRILEAIDFLDRMAGSQPLVINMSVGRHGGPHDGKTLVEMGIDAFLRSKKDRFIVQSTGNYFMSKTHASGKLSQGHKKDLNLWVNPGDRTPNEIEVWYDGKDRMTATVHHPKTGLRLSISPDNKKQIWFNGEVIGRMYHRTNEPNNHRNHVDIFLFPNAPSGKWELTIKANKVRQTGEFHAWIERDGGIRNQSKFFSKDADPSSTTGTICNGHESIVVGAYDSRISSFIKPAPFSSMGPTLDGRIKPNLVAPGVSILAARSSPRPYKRSTYQITRMSGTSMAAPHVAGAVAALRQTTGPLHARKAKAIILAAAQRVRGSSQQLGQGLLDVGRLFGVRG